MQIEDGPPNFFCRLPPSEKAKNVDRSASPPPLAFLQHIFENYGQLEEEVGESSKSHLQGDAIGGRKDRGNGVVRSATGNSSSSEATPIEYLRNGARITNLSVVNSPTVESNADEAPWFSQLANLPQVRSAGIPMLTPGTAPRSSQAPLTRKPTAPEPTIPSSTSSSATASVSRQMEPSASSTSMQTSSSRSSIDGVSSNGVLTSSADTITPISKPTSEGKAHSSAPPLKHSTTSTSSAPLVPPENFAMVNSWVYRSSFPKKRHFPFLKTLGLKSVLTLILEEYPEQNTQFLDDNGITFFQFGIPGNKEPFVHIPPDKITAALITILDRRNHPMLIHCNKGKHRTGCLIGCLRKLQQWSLTTIFDEYRRFSIPKSRSMDQEFIELYSESRVWLQVERRWLPRWAVLAKGGGRGSRIDEEGQAQQERDHKTAAHSSLSLTVDAVHRLKMKGM